MRTLESQGGDTLIRVITLYRAYNCTQSLLLVAHAVCQFDNSIEVIRFSLAGDVSLPGYWIANMVSVPAYSPSISLIVHFENGKSRLKYVDLPAEVNMRSASLRATT